MSFKLYPTAEISEFYYYHISNSLWSNMSRMCAVFIYNICTVSANDALMIIYGRKTPTWITLKYGMDIAHIRPGLFSFWEWAIEYVKSKHCKRTWILYLCQLCTLEFIFVQSYYSSILHIKSVYLRTNRLIQDLLYF